MSVTIKKCSKCQQAKPTTDFYNPSDSRCRDCNLSLSKDYYSRHKSRAKKYRRDNKDKLNDYAKDWRTKNAASYAKYQREWRDKNPGYWAKRRAKQKLENGVKQSNG